MTAVIIETKGVLKKKKKLSPDTHLFNIKPEQPMQFQPGQFITVNPKPEDVTYKRSFSIASTPQKNNILELCIKIVPDGKVSPLLERLPVGEKVALKGPYGNFTLHSSERELIFIAGGTGIAPLRSMLQSLAEQKTKRKIWLFYRFKNPEDFLFEKELQELQKKINLKIIPSVSNGSADWKGERERIQEIIMKYIDNPKEKEVYICGPPLMVRETTEQLQKFGFDPAYLHKEMWG